MKDNEGYDHEINFNMNDRDNSYDSFMNALSNSKQVLIMESVFYYYNPETDYQVKINMN